MNPAEAAPCGENALMRGAVRIGLALLLLASMVFYVERVVVPYQQTDARNHDRPRGNLSDLYPRWLGARELLLHGRDPYSAEITREIQVGYYGRPLEAGRPGDPRDQQGFAYPVYVVFLLAPTIMLPFSIVQPAFFWILLALTAASVPLWLYFLRWNCSYAATATIGILTVGSFAAWQGFKLQQLSLLVGALIALSAASLSRGRLFSSGVLMAFAMIKPQLAIPVAGWFLLWVAGDWGSRRRYALGFTTALSSFMVASEWVLPGWIGRFLNAVAAYRDYVGSTSSLLETLSTPVWGRSIAAVIVLIVLRFCWGERTAAATAPGFIRATTLVLTATVVVVPMIALYNQVLLLPAILTVVREWSRLGNSRLIIRVLTLAGSGVVAWPWIGAGALMIYSAFAMPEQVQQWWPVPLYSSILIPLAVLMLQGIVITTDAQGFRLTGDASTP